MALSSISRDAQQLDSILRAGSGSLAEHPYPTLLLALALRQKSAVLTLTRGPLQKEIVFDDGSPVECRSNIATEAFGRFLVGSGRLSEANHAVALSHSTARGVPVEDILLEQKLIAAADLYRLLQQSLGRKLLDPFSWKTGTFEISFAVPPVESALRVRVPQLVLTGVAKVEMQEYVDEAMSFANDLFLGLAAEPLFPLDEVRLSSDQKKILDAAREGKQVRDVAAFTGIDEDDVRRVLYALLLLGAVTLSETAVRELQFELDHPFAPSAPPPVAAAAPVAVPAPVAQTNAASEDEVIAAYLSYRRKDAFDLLGVGETDGMLQFNRAFLAISDRFLPSKFEDPLREQAQEVFLAVARAYGELADPLRRDALREARAKKRMPVPVVATPAPTRPADPAPQRAAAAPMLEVKSSKPAIVDPEQLCRNGRELAEAGKLREALSSFELAAQCDAQNGTYAAEVAWCRFRMNVSPATTTLKMLKNAVRIDPRAGLAFLYAGRIATILGNRTEASNYLDRAAMMMPKDMRVVEALKALRA
jgi:tetratricopeptide (TPR) repeat protein